MKPIIGTNIKKIRRWRGLKLVTLAEASGLNKSTLSELENHVHHPSVWTVAKVADAFNCDIEKLLKPDLQKDDL